MKKGDEGMDRRQRKTRQAIIDACYQLIEEKELQKVTINDITEKADINRGTFYLHFTDKFDMLDSFEKEMIDKIHDVIIHNMPSESASFNQEFLPSRYDTIIDILQCYKDNKEIMQIILHSGNARSFKAKLEGNMKYLIDQEIIKRYGEHIDIPSDLLIKIFSSVALSFAEYNYSSKEDVDVEKVAEFIFRVVLQGPAKTMGFIETPNKK